MSPIRGENENTCYCVTELFDHKINYAKLNGNVFRDNF